MTSHVRPDPSLAANLRGNELISRVSPIRFHDYTIRLWGVPMLQLARIFRFREAEVARLLGNSAARVL